jgi:sulfur transfer complex TusBCD TusB component (DsrH family)
MDDFAGIPRMTIPHDLRERGLVAKCSAQTSLIAATRIIEMTQTGIYASITGTKYSIRI